MSKRNRRLRQSTRRNLRDVSRMAQRGKAVDPHARVKKLYQRFVDLSGMSGRVIRSQNGFPILQAVTPSPKTRTQAGNRAKTVLQHIDSGRPKRKRIERYTRLNTWKRSPGMVGGPTAGKAVSSACPRAQMPNGRGHLDLYPKKRSR